MEKDKQKRKTVNNDTVSLRNTLNKLTGAECLYSTKSILITAYPSEYGHEIRKVHGANKPPQLMAQLIEFFTKPQGRVLDPFAGVGGTLIGASICKQPRDILITICALMIPPTWPISPATMRTWMLWSRSLRTAIPNIAHQYIVVLQKPKI